MPSNKPFNEEAPRIAEDIDVRRAKDRVRNSLGRLEESVGRLADKIENSKTVTYGWPVVLTSWRALRVLRKNPWWMLAAGGLAGGAWAYKKWHKPKKASRRSHRAAQASS
jgi:hypothetical protein